jgi:hypothetical protein
MLTQTALGQDILPPKNITGQRSYLLPNCPLVTRQELNRVLDPSEVLSGLPGQSEAWVAVVAGALLEPLVGVAADYVGEWLNKRASEQTGKTAWLTAGHLPAKCLVLIRGSFLPTPAKISDDDLKSGAGTALAAWDWPKAWRDLYQLDKAPDVYLEIALDRSRDGSAVRLSPLFVDFRRSTLQPSRAGDLYLALTMELVLGGQSLSASAIALPPLKSGTRLLPAHLVGVTSAWITLPRVLNDDGSIAKGRSPSAPLTIQTTFVESAQPTAVDRLISKTFMALKAPLVRTVTEAARSASPSGGIPEEKPIKGEP